MRNPYDKTIVGLPIIVLILMASVLASACVSAEDSVIDEISLAVPIACTMEGTGQNSHNANINNGTYTPNVGSTTLHALCNDNEGFAIYAAGYTGNEIGGVNSNKLVGTSASNNASIESGLAAAAGNPDVSNWAMKLAITGDSGDTTGANAFALDSAPNTAGGADASFGEYHVVPNEYTKVAHKNLTTDMTETIGGVKLTTTYAAYISKTQAADTYSGQVIYTLVHPASAEAPKVPVSCNPNGTTIGVGSGTDIKCMQDFASLSSSVKSTLVSDMALGRQYTLIDKRDEKEYTLAKLADGKVWMTKNLDLDIDSSRTYTNEDTDLGWNTQTNTYQTASWTPSRSTYATTTNNIHEWCQGGTWNSQYNYCENNNTPESYDPGELYWNGETSDGIDWRDYDSSCNAGNCDESLNPISSYTSIADDSIPQYHVGNFYNWAAAIASNDASVYGVDDEGTEIYENKESHQSICPSGWTLPYISRDTETGEADGDYLNLWTAYGLYGYVDNISAMWSAPLYFIPGGHFAGYYRAVGWFGRFWASAVSNDVVAEEAEFDVSGGAFPYIFVTSRYDGTSLRCVLR